MRILAHTDDGRFLVEIEPSEIPGMERCRIVGKQRRASEIVKAGSVFAMDPEAWNVWAGDPPAWVLEAAAKADG